MRHTKIAVAEPFVGAPKINIAKCIGASPNKPIIIKIPITGQRPLKITAEDLPGGLALDGAIISGAVEKENDYDIVIRVENDLGICEKKVTLEVHPDRVQLTPLLGFTSWNAFGFDISREKIERTAQKMLDLGITEYGYNHINIDSGWQGVYGGEFDAIMPNEKFPDMKGFCDKLHGMGYKCGIYSTPMLNAFGCSINRPVLPPGCTQGEPDDRFSDERGGIGLIRKEKNNALQWAAWGFDYLKYDWRPSDPYNAELMRSELVKTDRDFGFCVSVRARPEYHKYWEKYCNSYRCNPDSIRTWANLMEIYRSHFDFIDYINKGHYFDLDMLDTGDCELFDLLEYPNDPNFGFTEDEQLVAFSMRAILSSPIQISSKLDCIGEFELSMYCNEDVIEINQDFVSSARPCVMLEDGRKILHAYKKKLSGGDEAYALFNLGETRESFTVYLDEPRRIRDIWAKEDCGISDKLTYNMHPHTVRLFRVSQKN